MKNINHFLQNLFSETELFLELSEALQADLNALSVDDLITLAKDERFQSKHLELLISYLDQEKLHLFYSQIDQNLLFNHFENMKFMSRETLEKFISRLIPLNEIEQFVLDPRTLKKIVMVIQSDKILIKTIQFMVEIQISLVEKNDFFNNFIKQSIIIEQINKHITHSSAAWDLLSAVPKAAFGILFKDPTFFKLVSEEFDTMTRMLDRIKKYDAESIANLLSQQEIRDKINTLLELNLAIPDTLTKFLNTFHEEMDLDESGKKTHVKIIASCSIPAVVNEFNKIQSADALCLLLKDLAPKLRWELIATIDSIKTLYLQLVKENDQSLPIIHAYLKQGQAIRNYKKIVVDTMIRGLQSRSGTNSLMITSFELREISSVNFTQESLKTPVQDEEYNKFINQTGANNLQTLYSKFVH